MDYRTLDRVAMFGVGLVAGMIVMGVVIQLLGMCGVL